MFSKRGLVCSFGLTRGLQHTEACSTQIRITRSKQEGRNEGSKEGRKAGGKEGRKEGWMVGRTEARMIKTRAQQICKITEVSQGAPNGYGPMGTVINNPKSFLFF